MQALLLYSLIFFHGAFATLQNTKSIISSDTRLNISQLATKYGYPFEKYEVETEDGYILGLHRIPYGKDNSTSNETRPVVLLMHAFTGVSTYWVNAASPRALAYYLADAGYDVWLINQRGNFYSLKHKTLDPVKNKAAFFNYSMHEVGVYDLPATIDFILNATEQDSLYFGAHSQGTNNFFILTTEKPEYNDKIKFMFNLGPTVYVNDIPSPLPRLIAKFYTLLELFTDIFKIYRFFPRSELLADLSIVFCNKITFLTRELCADVFFILCGFDSPQFNRTLITVISNVQPAGSSIKTLKHLVQLVNSGIFRNYDYGTKGNLLEYGQDIPPQYNLSLVTAPIGIYYGQNDWFSTVSNSERLADELPNVASLKLINYTLWNHADFIWAIDVIPLCYSEVLEDLEQYK